MIDSASVQTQKATIDLLKKGAAEIARKDAAFLQKRLDSLHKEMSLMTKLLAGTQPQNQKPILSGLEQLGDRLKSAGRAVETFSSSRGAYFSKNLKGADLSEFQNLQNALTKNFLDLSGHYTALGGGAKIRVESNASNPYLQKIIDDLV